MYLVQLRGRFFPLSWDPFSREPPSPYRWADLLFTAPGCQDAGSYAPGRPSDEDHRPRPQGQVQGTHAPRQGRPIERPDAVTPYAELHCHSHYSFLDGASSPSALVDEAVRLGLHGLALTDHDGFYGAPMLAEAAAAQAKAAADKAAAGATEAADSARRADDAVARLEAAFSSSVTK